MKEVQQPWHITDIYPFISEDEEPFDVRIDVIHRDAELFPLSDRGKVKLNEIIFPMSPDKVRQLIQALERALIIIESNEEKNP